MDRTLSVKLLMKVRRDNTPTEGRKETRTASAQVSTDMDQVHTPTEGRKTQGQHQHKFPQTYNKFTHLLRTGKHKDRKNTNIHTHITSTQTNRGKKNTRSQKTKKKQQTH